MEISRKIFISGILLSIWIILFDIYYTFLFSIFLLVVFIVEIYLDFLSISAFRFLRNENHSSLCSCFLSSQNSSALSQTSIRRLMLLRIQNLFHPTRSKTMEHSNDHHQYSFFDYRCPVCLNNKQDSFRWIALGCGHILCSFCIQHLYFGTKPICPHCRSSIILSDLTILYI